MTGGDGWFDDARFGMFVHWGPYSAMGLEPSWPLVGGIPALPRSADVSVADYYAGAARWSPPSGAPARWARAAADAGMAYAILTTKHHDGYTLFPSEHAPLGVHTTAAGVDLVGEFVAALRAEGLRVGLYYSLADWSHPDYPPFSDAMRPYPALAYPRPEPAAWARFLADQRAQLDHLLTAYGPIDIVWFDGGWERTPDEWDAAGLEAFIRERQPDVLFNDRLPGVPGYTTAICEQIVPFDTPGGRWETCVTLDDSWGPLADGGPRKSTHEILALLGDAVAGGGRLLLNVAPDGDGALLDWQAARLHAVARWMGAHRRAVAAARPAGLRPGQHYGPATTDGEELYLWCPARPIGEVTFRAVHPRRVTGVRALGTDQALAFRPRLGALEALFGGDPVGDLVIDVPASACDDTMTVLAVSGLGALGG